MLPHIDEIEADARMEYQVEPGPNQQDRRYSAPAGVAGNRCG